jgi:hypothetical protein
MPETETDPLATPVAPPPPPARGASRPTCEFCECRLTHSGEVLEFSEKAKGFRKHSQTIEELNGTIATLRQEKETAEAKVRELEAGRSTSTSSKKNFLAPR